MKGLFRLALLLFAATGLTWAHPVFSTNSIVNAASFVPAELPAGNIARGSIFTIFGEDMGPPAGVMTTEFPLPLDLGTVTIEVRQGVTSVAAIPLFANEFQLNAILPSNAPLGKALLIVRFQRAQNGIPDSSPVEVNIVDGSFGVFTVNSSGVGPAIVTNFRSESDQPLNSTLESAEPGQFITIWGTGLGPIEGSDREPPIEVGGVVDLKERAGVEVFIGGRPATNIFYAGRSAGFSALDQIIVQVPEDAPTGCYVPFMVRLRGEVASNTPTMSIQPGGGPCQDELNAYVGPEVIGSGFGTNLGVLTLVRNAVTVSGQSSVSDTGNGSFQTMLSRPWFFNPAVAAPAMGTCVVYNFRNQSGGIPNRPPVIPLDAGIEVVVRGPNGPKSLPRTPTPGFHAAIFGTTRQPPLYLDSGMYAFEARGGNDVGPFNAAINMPPTITWTNREQVDTIRRGQDLTITWKGGDATQEYVRILGISESSPNPSNQISGIFLCSAPLEGGSMTIPGNTFSNIPESVLNQTLSTGFLFIGTSPKSGVGRFEAQGLDYGFVSYQNMTGKPVKFE